MSLRSFAIGFALLSSIVAEAADSALIAFSRANIDKYKNELVEVRGLRLGSRLTVTIKVDSNDILGYGIQYIPEYEAITFPMLATVNDLNLSELCNAAGRFRGQNSFGVKAAVQRRSCERFVLVDADAQAARLGGTQIPATPSEFREIKRSGVQVDVDFTIGELRDFRSDVVVDFDEAHFEATVSKPVETNLKVWRVFGQINELWWRIPGRPTPVSIWRRDQ
jgi:hypothetical protein